MVPDEQIPMLEQVTDLLLDPLRTTGGACAAFEAGRPRPSLGAPAARPLRSLATAERTALVTSRRTCTVRTQSVPCGQLL